MVPTKLSMENYKGKKIESIKLVLYHLPPNEDSGYEEDYLAITFSSGEKIKFFDAGQMCCERRYMSTDDDPKYFVGSTFLGYEIKEWGGSEYLETEIQFLEIQTSKGILTLVNHNEHNGYYGGFDLRVVEE